MDDLFEISQVTLGRLTLAGFRTETRQDHANCAFRFEVVLNRRRPKLNQTAEGSKITEHLLDTAETP